MFKLTKSVSIFGLLLILVAVGMYEFSEIGETITVSIMTCGIAMIVTSVLYDLYNEYSSTV